MIDKDKLLRDMDTKVEQIVSTQKQKLVAVRPYPRGIYLDKKSPDETIFRVKSVHRRWRFAMYWVGLIGFPIAIYLGTTMGMKYDRAGWYRGWTPIPMVILCVIVVLAMIWAWLKGHPKLKIIAKPDTLQVAHLIFDRQHYHGMRIGYEVQGEAVNIGAFNTVMGDHFMGVSGLRVAYGRWGEDLDYMVNKYHAPEYVVWINEVIAEVGKPAPKEHDPSQGVKKAEF